MMNFKKIAPVALAAVAVAVPALSADAAAPPSATSAAVRQFEGTVVSVNRDARTFRLRDSEAGTKRIKVTGSTRFERIAGFSGLKPGMKRVEATVKRSNGRWVATSVEISGGGGDHGGRDGSSGRGGHDDGPGHT
jgi:azurin